MDEPKVRISARALIINNDKLLTIKMNLPAGIFYMLSGGGQKFGETLAETVKRECLEEIGANVTVGELSFVHEYRSMNHKWGDENNPFHQVNCIFSCSINNDYIPNNGSSIDLHQIGVEWLSIKKLETFSLYPASLIPILKKHQKSPIYLEDVS